MTTDPSPLLFPFADPPAPAQLIDVAPGVRWLRMPLPFALDHINLWLLEDGDGWAIVDTGIGSSVTHQLWEQIFATHLSGRPVTRVIVTHHHPDHAGSAAWLAERWGVDVWMTQTEFLQAHAVHANIGGSERGVLIDFYRRHGLDDVRLRAQVERGNGYARIVPSLPKTFRRMIEDDEIAIGASRWRVIIGRGHAPEHAALYCAEKRLLVSGDQVLPRITTNVSVWGDQPDADPLQQFLHSMQRFESLAPDTLVLPSHERVFRGLHARLDALRAHHAARLEEIGAACAQPRSAAELIPVLFKRQLDDHQIMFAMGETVAHLNRLWYAGTLRRAVDANAVLRFSAA